MPFTCYLGPCYLDTSTIMQRNGMRDEEQEKKDGVGIAVDEVFET